MVEWHLPPDYILDNWTDEQLDLYVEKLVERKKREVAAMRPGDSGKVPMSMLFAQAKNVLKVVKK
ncbi:hypothetical protein ES703_49486 [subsurface metagenome]